jgi:choline dehydrogenase-like flavoprotein/pimeloyl-ACP methyl ester carboxylesterase
LPQLARKRRTGKQREFGPDSTEGTAIQVGEIKQWDEEVNMTNQSTNEDSSLKVSPGSTAWISRGLEQLIFDLAARKADPAANRTGLVDFDVVIIGSGYGGAIAAAELAGSIDGKKKKVSVCVLERGREYLPGMFPSRMADLAGHVRCSTAVSRGPIGRREGLFDVRLGPDVCALLANGVGGGSLINAGVMEKPVDSIFSRWPHGFGQDPNRDNYYERARAMLGATVQSDQGLEQNTILLHPDGPPLKYEALRSMSKPHGQGTSFSSAAITVAMNDKRNEAGVELKQCIQCGDCATGCNHGAKESLDTNLLVRAARKGADIVTGATVHKIARSETGEGWCIDVFHTDEELRQRQGPAFKIQAAKIILAAGTFGTTEILLRSGTPELKFSRHLGQRFSSNGDSIFVAYDQKHDVNAVSNEDIPAIQRKIGPTITGMIDRRLEDGTLVQELAVPGPLRRLLEEASTVAATLHQLEFPDTTIHAGNLPAMDPCAINPEIIRKSSILAVMGDDGAEGALELIGGDAETDGDGAICVRWPELRDKALFPLQQDTLAGLMAKSKTGGQILPNPLWRLLPESMEFLLNGDKGPLFTVHPLGGCAMGETADTAVTDQYGRVFNAEPNGEDALYKDLVVLDGSIIPSALGINPALTISAIALRAVEKLREEWDYSKGESALPVNTARPIFKVVDPIKEPRPTMIEIVERLCGKVPLYFNSSIPIPYVIELTLRFEPASLQNLMGPMQRNIKIMPNESMLRIFEEKMWDELREKDAPEEELKKAALLSANVEGTLHLFHRQPSTPEERSQRAWGAWFWNRGLRDAYQWLREEWQKTGCILTREVFEQAKKRARNAKALSTRAGEVRLLDYELAISNPELSDAFDTPDFIKNWDKAPIRGTKRLTYSRRSNPWRQLSDVFLTEFPGISSGNSVLSLDTKYLAKQGVPLFRVVDQENQPAALVDLASFGLYLLRLLLSIHMWSFRKPDASELGEPQRLPGNIPGLPAPKVKELEVDRLPDGTPVYVRLTRYECYTTTQVPVVMIHGYSASGTSFTHPAIDPNLASYMNERKRDVWVLDLRTSCGMPTARYPWTFEDAAFADIPAAFDYIRRETGSIQLDVVAHCMGSAMFSMAVLARPKEGERFFRERESLPGWIRRAVLSQVAPLVVFSPDNIFRAYLMGYLRYFLPLANYKFRIGPDPSLTDQLIDRLLATLPYPKEEFDLENPPYAFWRQTPFVGTRHRMDALYGRDFSLTNVDRDVLKYIDDLFGPLSIETVSQAIHFARLQQVTNRAGRNAFVSRSNFRDRWGFPTLSIHGEENGLADVATLARMKAFLQDDLGLDYQTLKFSGFGHQDCWIGREASSVFSEVSRFLGPETSHDATSASSARPAPRPVGADSEKLLPEIPALGPIIGLPDKDKAGEIRILVGAGANPALGQPVLAAFVPVVRCSDKDKFFPYLPEKTESGQVFNSSSWLMAIADDNNGWIRLNPLVKSWPNDAKGVLMTLFYDQPGILATIAFALRQTGITNIDSSPRNRRESLAEMQFTFSEQVSFIESRPEIPKSALPTFEALIQFLTDTIHLAADRVWNAINELLENNSATTLNSGLISSPLYERVREALTDRNSSSELQDEPIQTSVAQNMASQLHFVLASCQYPAGMLDELAAQASFSRLVDLLGSNKLFPDRPPFEFLLLAGDQVYVDATAGLFDPTLLDDRYYRPYEKLYSMKPLQSLMRQFPTYTILDDHEISDNWEPGADDVRTDKRLIEGRKAFWKFERFSMGFYPKPDGDSSYPLWNKVSVKGFPFFVADTRTERTARSPSSIESARIMSKKQFHELTEWLKAESLSNTALPKFIASSSIVLPRKLRAIENRHVASALRSDSWEGFPYSFHRLLATIADTEIQNVIFLSGDEHLSCVARGVLRRLPDGKPVVIHSIHSSALYAPFPFANSVPGDFADTELFEFQAPDKDNPEKVIDYECSVSTEFACRGDGFAILHIEEINNHWRMGIEFHQRDGRQDFSYDLG